MFTSYDALRDRLGGVTNLLLTCEALQVFPADLFSKAKLQSVTIASTNLTTASSQAFGAAAKTLKEIVFLAYPPTTAAGDKRYYLVQRDSKYDVRHGLYLILK